MKKGCIIALVAFALLIIAVSGWFFHSYAPKLQQAFTVRLIQDIESAIEKYEEDHGKLDEEKRGDLVGILRGNNPDERDYFNGRVDGNVVNKQIVDAWRRPLQSNVDRKGMLRFSSAGVNGEFGDGDDLTSEGTKGPKLPKPSG